MDARLRNYKRRAASGDPEAIYAYMAVLEQVVGEIIPYPDPYRLINTPEAALPAALNETVLRTLYGTNLILQSTSIFIRVNDVETQRLMYVPRSGIGESGGYLAAWGGFLINDLSQILMTLCCSEEYWTRNLPNQSISRPIPNPNEAYLREWKRLALENINATPTYIAALERVVEGLNVLPEIMIDDDYPPEIIVRTVHGTELRSPKDPLVVTQSWGDYYLRVCSYAGEEIGYWSEDELEDPSGYALRNAINHALNAG